ncbi:ABC transporter ATP-binding protein [Desulfopila sp. IMCC35008]|uniref:ABC transporter ATP-binding protein n=1 Tax=Desulfopila sp. IMCC35008 TaxID=2653858 RepID=UPI0013D027DB|nr:ABC transporter ATP-binding protein [Desulfopila sp. IMCC35008]
MEILLTVEHLRKEYRQTVAVQDVSFQVERGSCFGLLGPNGAGKTTTIEIIEDIIPPTRGTITFKGAPRSVSFREEIGIQFQHTSLLNYLSVEETLQAFAKLFTSPVDLDQLMLSCDLTSLHKRKNTELSGGQLQRLMLALALINDPELIFLDEPSTGLDPQSRRNMWALVDDIKSREKTIIMTTHSMEEAQYLCDRIAIMDRGLIIAEGSPEELIRHYCPVATISLPARALPPSTPSIPFIYNTEEDTIRIKTKHIEEVVHFFTDNNIPLAEMTIHSPTMEDVFLHLTGRTLRD